MTDDNKKYFNVRIEFDRDRLDSIIFDAIERGIPGYSCSVEANNLTVANKNPEFLDVLNGALVNNCDGSVLAKILARIHHKDIDSYIGADIFIKYVKMKRFRQFFPATPRKFSPACATISRRLTRKSAACASRPSLPAPSMSLTIKA